MPFDGVDQRRRVIPMPWQGHNDRVLAERAKLTQLPPGWHGTMRTHPRDKRAAAVRIAVADVAT